MLWFEDEPAGICLFTSPTLSLAARNHFFGLSGKWSRVVFRTRNSQLVNLSRVVIHPTFRGAGIATAFVRRSCELCPYPWIETLTQIGHINPFFEATGFRRVGTARQQHSSWSRAQHSSLYGTRSRHTRSKTRGRKSSSRKPIVTKETYEKSRYAQPVYYVFDNRAQKEDGPQEGHQKENIEENGEEIDGQEESEDDLAGSDSGDDSHA